MKLPLSPTALSSVADGSAGVLRIGMSKASSLRILGLVSMRID
jgi:hypothetical protein